MELDLQKVLDDREMSVLLQNKSANIDEIQNELDGTSKIGNILDKIEEEEKNESPGENGPINCKLINLQLTF